MTDQPDYFLRGNDGQNYPASRAAMWEWIRSGRVRRDQQVYDTLTQSWSPAGAHSDLRAAFMQAAAPQAGSAPTRYSQRAFAFVLIAVCILVWGTYSFVWGYAFAAAAAISTWAAAKRGKRPLRYFFGPSSGSMSQAVILGILAVALIVTASIAASQEWRQLRVQAIEKEENDKAAAIRETLEKKHEAELRDRSGTFVTTLTATLAEAQKFYQKGDFRQAHDDLAKAKEVGKEYLNLKPLPPELTDPSSKLRELSDKVDRAYHVNESLKKAHELIAKKQWIPADDTLKSAAEAAKQLPDENRSTLSSEIVRTQKSITSRVSQAREYAEREKFFEALCGPSPTLSAWDGGVYQIEQALKQVAHDPDSIDVENCTQPYLDRKRCWVTRCQVRGKNAFGAKVLNIRTFSVSKLGVDEIE